MGADEVSGSGIPLGIVGVESGVLRIDGEQGFQGRAVLLKLIVGDVAAVV